MLLKRVKLRAVAIVVFDKVEGEVFYSSVPCFTDAFIRNNDLVVAAQCTFCTQFHIPLSSVPDCKSIMLCVKNFGGTGSVMKKHVGRLCLPIRLNTSMQFKIQFWSLHNARGANMQLLFNYPTTAVVEFYTLISSFTHIKWSWTKNF